jgi:hypothetical protein
LTKAPRRRARGRRRRGRRRRGRRRKWRGGSSIREGVIRRVRETVSLDAVFVMEEARNAQFDLAIKWIDSIPVTLKSRSSPPKPAMTPPAAGTGRVWKNCQSSA